MPYSTTLVLQKYFNLTCPLVVHRLGLTQLWRKTELGINRDEDGAVFHLLPPPHYFICPGTENEWMDGWMTGWSLISLDRWTADEFRQWSFPSVLTLQDFRKKALTNSFIPNLHFKQQLCSVFVHYFWDFALITRLQQLIIWTGE